VSDKPWKAFERTIAKSLGTVRTPLSGSASRLTSSDTLHPTLYVECKLAKRLALTTRFWPVCKKASDESKEPVLAMRKKHSHLTMAVIEWDFFLQLWDCYANIGIEAGWLDRQGIPREKE